MRISAPIRLALGAVLLIAFVPLQAQPVFARSQLKLPNPQPQSTPPVPVIHPALADGSSNNKAAAQKGQSNGSTVNTLPRTRGSASTPVSGAGYNTSSGTAPGLYGRPNPPESELHPAPGRAAQNQEHLAQWMERHRNLDLAEQQRALQSEPGFRDLPPQVQQRYRDQLVHLNNMDPQQRIRMLDRTEALERLNPTQRQLWRNSVEQLHDLPAARRMLVTRAILNLRPLSPQQRQQALESAPYRTQLTDSERAMLSTILTVEPSPAAIASR